MYLYAVNSGGQSPAARVTALLPSGTPRSYRVVGVGNGRVSLAWSTPAAGPPSSGYRLSYAPAGGAWRSINLGSRTSWTLTGLRNGTRYYMYLYALHSGGRSPAARVSALLPSGTPRSYRVVGVGSGRVSLAWSTPAAGAPSSGYLLSLRAGWRGLAQHLPRIANELDAHRTAQWHEVLRLPLRPAQRRPIACRQSHGDPRGGAPANYSGNCPAATNTPGGRDPWGGCWPGPSNTGVPNGVALSAYTGPCRITTPNTVIDRRVVNCDLEIAASGVVIRNSRINGTVGMAGGSLTIYDSEVIGGPPEPRLHDDRRPEHHHCSGRGIGGNRGILCDRGCVVRDSWVHGQFVVGDLHVSGIRQSQGATLIHNSVVCDTRAHTSRWWLLRQPLVGYGDSSRCMNNRIQRICS